MAPRLAETGVKIAAVRLDSGDLIPLARRVRSILDDGGLSYVSIFASGGLDEDYVAEIVQTGAPIDGPGIGTSLTTSSDVPALDCAHKFEEMLDSRAASVHPEKRPGLGVISPDDTDQTTLWPAISCPSNRGSHPGEQLLEPVMKDGHRLRPAPTLAEIRTRARQDLERLPEPLRNLEPDMTYRVEVADALIKLAAAVDQRLAQSERAAH